MFNSLVLHYTKQYFVFLTHRWHNKESVCSPRNTTITPWKNPFSTICVICSISSPSHGPLRPTLPLPLLFLVSVSAVFPLPFVVRLVRRLMGRLVWWLVRRFMRWLVWGLVPRWGGWGVVLVAWGGRGSRGLVFTPLHFIIEGLSISWKSRERLKLSHWTRTPHRCSPL